MCISNFYQLHNPCSVQECLSSEDISVQAPQASASAVTITARGKLIDHPDAVPVFTIENVVDYMINRKESDCMRAEDWKSFKAGGFKLFKEGHVQNIFINRDDTKLEVECKCLPEMKKDRVYNLSLRISVETSSVDFAECSCPAGRGPHGSCKHIAATLFALENFYSFYEEARSEDEISCTSKLQKWNQPRKRRLDSQPSNDIGFKVEQYDHKPCCISKDFFDPRPLNLQKTTDEELQAFTENLQCLKISCGFLDLMVASNDTSLKLPMTPRSAQSRVNAQIIKEVELPPTLQAVVSYSGNFLKLLQPDEEQRKAVEKATRRQSSSKRWREERYLRLTASNFGRVMLRKSNYGKLAEEILFTKLPDYISSLKWGRLHESDAFSQYLESQPESEQKNIRKAGFYIGEPSFLGASPDGVIEGSDNLKIIEIKCPYSIRDLEVEEACTKTDFYCTLNNGLFHLKRNHQYYHQVQGTMAITNAHACDFVVWTPKSMKVETILFDRTLWQETMFPKLSDFYHEYVLPCILY